MITSLLEHNVTTLFLQGIYNEDEEEHYAYYNIVVYPIFTCKIM